MKQYRDTNYFISEYGDVFRKRGNQFKPIKSVDTGKGYSRVNIWSDGKCKLTLVHRLVAECYIPNPNNLPIINHKDGIKNNNNITNLEWCTYSHNMKHRSDVLGHGKGEKNPNSKLKMIDVEYIRNTYPNKSMKQLAEQYNVSITTIFDVIKYKRFI